MENLSHYKNISKNDLEEFIENTLFFILGKRNQYGFWEGYLSSSAVATSIAIFTLYLYNAEKYKTQIKKGLEWIINHSNEDGGWGDSPSSPSNITATLLVWASMSIEYINELPYSEKTLLNAEKWLLNKIGSLTPENIIKALEKRYGNDKTFFAPILTMLVISGRLGKTPDAWKNVPQLPFELAILPDKLWRLLKMEVVSYAIPALIGIGIATHKNKPTSNILLRSLRNILINRLISIAEEMQPENGGYEEATPLVGFICMSLISAGFKDSKIVKKCIDFILISQRQDGSWPIDTHLSTWISCQIINAMSLRTSCIGRLSKIERQNIIEWLINQQHLKKHPLTRGGYGGWSWTYLPGGMPDADDTCAVLIALKNLGARFSSYERNILAGINWLLSIQNNDGGIPTFSKGWGKLPFDRSCPDITSHAIRALSIWYNDLPEKIKSIVKSAIERMLNYLVSVQNSDGSWIPLWFGSQYTEDETNPVYGTSQVIISLTSSEISLSYKFSKEIIKKGVSFLLSTQNSDGGWGAGYNTPSTVEESAVALWALNCSLEKVPDNTILAGLKWLIDTTEKGKNFQSSPIGLYFAKLWYDEQLYSPAFTLGSLLSLDNSCLDKGNSKETYIMLFSSASKLIEAEEILSKSGIKCEPIPVPYMLSIHCSTALLVYIEQKELLEILASKIKYAEIYIQRNGKYIRWEISR